MSMKSSLITYMNTETNLTNLVSDRMFIGFAEQNTALPYIVLHEIDGVHEHHLKAASGFIQGRYQFDCHAATTISAENVAEQLRQSLDGYRGTMGSVFVSKCQLDSWRDDITPPIEGKHTGIYTVQNDYMIGWSVSVPTFA